MEMCADEELLEVSSRQRCAICLTLELWTLLWPFGKVCLNQIRPDRLFAGHLRRFWIVRNRSMFPFLFWTVCETLSQG